MLMSMLMLMFKANLDMSCPPVFYLDTRMRASSSRVNVGNALHLIVLMFKLTVVY